MRSVVCLILSVFLFCPAGCGVSEKIYSAAPSSLPNVSVDMKTSGFWISRHPTPDEGILSSDEIIQFNKNICEHLGLTKNLFAVSEVSGKQLREVLEASLRDMAGRTLFLHSGRRASDGFFEHLRQAMNFAAIPEHVSPRWGLIVRYADQRLLPTTEGLYAQKGDVDFDELQNSALDMGTPAAALHETEDGEWLYVQTSSSDGWIRAENAAMGSREEVEEFSRAQPFYVVVSPRADIFLDQKRIQYHGFAQMGTVFPALSSKGMDPEDAGVMVALPFRLADGKLILARGFARRHEVHRGFLPYTPRTILEQAFKMLNAPYGWGGMYGEQDCSRFLQQIFSTAGIALPRNSHDQALVEQSIPFPNGAETSPGEKREILQRHAVPGITLLSLKGHIMLYLGIVEEMPFVIHAAWAYREPSIGKDRVRALNRVAVSDLSLGEGSRKGSLLQRLKGMAVIRKE